MTISYRTRTDGNNGDIAPGGYGDAILYIRNPNLRPGRTVVDIGANRGQFALAARHCFADARIVSFEPLSGPAALWRAVFAGDARAALVEAAVGPEAGEAEIHVSARDDSSSLLPIAARITGTVYLIRFEKASAAFNAQAN
jgi:FkbM family methyltransferase